MNEDAKISRAGLQANFLDIIDDARTRLAQREFQLKESHDYQGNSHKAWVESAVNTIRHHFDAAEREIREQEGWEGI